MKRNIYKFSIVLLFIFFSNVVLFASQSKLIKLNTDNLSLVFEVDEKGCYFTGILEKNSWIHLHFYQKKSYRSVEYATKNEVYSTAGGKNFREPALRVTHLMVI